MPLISCITELCRWLQLHDDNTLTLCHQLDKGDQTRKPVLPSSEILKDLVSSVTKSLNLSLFGFDVIVENDTGMHYVIDINAFPGEPEDSYVGVGARGEGPSCPPHNMI